MKVVYAEQAKRDIAGIYDSIAIRSHASAQRVEDAMRRLCENAGHFPYLSSATDEPNVRRTPLVRYPYTVFYRVDAERGRVEIARVVLSKRVKSLGKIPEM